MILKGASNETAEVHCPARRRGDRVAAGRARPAAGEVARIGFLFTAPFGSPEFLRVFEPFREGMRDLASIGTRVQASLPLSENWGGHRW